MSSSVLDASALLALVSMEPGGEQVREAVRNGAAISTVNLSEVVAKLADDGVSAEEIHRTLDAFDLEAVGFDEALAYRAGLLRPLTRGAGLSLGDRCCLALAQQLDLPVLTADRSWQSLQLGVRVDVIR